MQKVSVRDADGNRKQLILLRIVGNTAYVCSERGLLEASTNPQADVEIGVPLIDIQFPEGKMKEAAG